MRKIISLLIASIIIFSAVTVLASDKEIKCIFVSPEAQNGDGSFEAPFGTIEEARDLIRELKKNNQYPSGGVTVYFREGVYTFTKTANLTSEDSGFENAPVVYRAYMDEQVTFVGGVELDLNVFEKVTDEKILSRLNSAGKDNILQFDLKTKGITNYGSLNIMGQGVAYFTMPGTDIEGVPVSPPPEIFFNNKVMTLAKYPNGDDWIYVGEVIDAGDEVEYWTDMNKTLPLYVPKEKRTYPPKPSVFEVDSDTALRMQKWKKAEEPWVYGWFKYDYSDVSLPVANIDYEKGIVTTKYPSPKKMQKNKRYYFYNLLEELDVPGEYYLNRDTGILYIYPPEAEGEILMSSLRGSIVKCENVSNVAFKSIAFKGTLSHGLVFEKCDNVSVELCTVCQTAEYGVNTLECTNFRFISNHIYDTGTGGISFTAPEGAYQNLTPSGNIVENCEFNNNGRLRATYSSAIFLAGVGITVRNNKIHDSQHQIMTLAGNDHTIEYNEIFDVLKSAGDSGAIYGGFSKQYRGNVIRNNYFHDLVSASGSDVHAVYSDDTLDGVIVESNIFENLGGYGMHINGGRANEFKNNILIEAGGTLILGASGMDPALSEGKYHIDRYNFPDFLDNPAYAKYPHFSDLLTDNWKAPKYTNHINNILISCKNDYRIGTVKGTSVSQVEEDNTLDKSGSFAYDDVFTDYENGVLTVKEDSSIYKKFPDFKTPDFMNMGMYTGKLKHKLTDTISFMVNSPKAYVGFEPYVLDDNRFVVTVKNEDGIYLPLRFLSDNLGGQISYDDTTGIVTAKFDENEMQFDLRAKNKDKSFILVENRILVSTAVLEKLYSKKADIYENGTVILSDNGNIILDDEVNLLSELERRLSNN